MTLPMFAGPLRVLVTDRFDDEAYKTLEASTLLAVSRARSPDLSQDDLSLVNALVIRSRTKIDETLLARAPALKVIVTSTSGFDHIDLVACDASNVKVMFTPDANAASAAELTFALVLACARKLPAAQTAVRNGDWKRQTLLGLELSGLTYGVLGLGRIGKRVAKMAQAFGMKVIAHDPFIDEQVFRSADCEPVSFNELFHRSDVISCHVPATPQTAQMVSLQSFEWAGKLKVFVNTSRGSIVSESVLIQALDNGFVDACGLDVFETEPLPAGSKLLNRPNVVATPHIGATTEGAFRASSMAAAQKIVLFAERGIVSDELPTA